MTTSLFRPGRVRLAAGLAAAALAGVLVSAATSAPGPVSLTYAADPAAAGAGCTGVTLAVIPAQGAIANAAGTEGGHFWWAPDGGGTCIGTVIEEVQFGAAAPVRTLRVIVYDAADPGGLTVASAQVGGTGQVAASFGVHRVFDGLSQVCLAAVSPVVASPDMPCVQLGQPGTAPQATQPAAAAAAGCTGVILAVIPAQGVVSNPAGTEGGHFWWAPAGGGTCVGTVIEEVQLTAAAPTRTLRVIIYDTATPGGATVATAQVTGTGPASHVFGIHQIFTGLAQVCLAATSPVVASPDMPCLQVGQPGTAPQATQPAAAPTATPTATPTAWPTAWPADAASLVVLVGRKAG